MADEDTTGAPAGSIEEMALTILKNKDLNSALSSFIGGIFRPIIKEEIIDALKLFKNTGEVGMPNNALQRDFDNS